MGRKEVIWHRYELVKFGTNIKDFVVKYNAIINRKFKGTWELVSFNIDEPQSSGVKVHIVLKTFAV